MEYNHFEYGEMLAEKLCPIIESKDKKRYYTCSESENLYDFTRRLSSVKDVVMIALDGCNSDYEMNGADALLEIPQYFFLFLQTAKTDSPADILAKQKGCKRICEQVQAYMLQEMKQPFKTTPLKCLQPDSFTIRGIGPVGDNFYGALLGFNFKLSTNYQLDSEYWVEKLVDNQGKVITDNNDKNLLGDLKKDKTGNFFKG